MSKTTPFSALESKLDYIFQNKDVLRQALTRQSAIAEKVAGAAGQNYQRLEWLGDRAFNHCIAEILDQRMGSDASVEAIDAAYKSLTGNQGPLVSVARTLGLDKWIIRGQGEQTVTDKMLADAMEAVMGAIDSETSRKRGLGNFITKHFEKHINAAIANPASSTAASGPSIRLIDTTTPGDSTVKHVPATTVASSRKVTTPMPGPFAPTHGTSVPAPAMKFPAPATAKSKKTKPAAPSLTDHQKATCLIFSAALANDPAEARTKIEAAKQLDPNAINKKSRGKKYTPLHLALKTGHADTAELLINSGAQWADWSRNSKNGKTKTKTADSFAEKGGLSAQQVQGLKAKVR